MSKTNQRRFARLRRKKHIQKTIRGTAERPRLSVFRSSRHIYVQVIDDVSGRTLASASTLAADLRDREDGTGNIAAAKEVGKIVAERAKAAGVEAVCFDRNGFLYHGRVKALADSAREAGLRF